MQPLVLGPHLGEGGASAARAFEPESVRLSDSWRHGAPAAMDEARGIRQELDGEKDGLELVD
eukprot:9781636-Lingulodinium_polyedra.AAC.1